MGGKSSRDKGARGERNLVMYLRTLGYDARRVIRTRAVSGYEKDIVPDVVIHEDGQIKHTFENKFRKNSYATIYKLYEKNRDELGTFRFGTGKQGPFVAIGCAFEDVKRVTDVHFPIIDTYNSPDKRTLHRILNLNLLLKGAGFLVIKDNNHYPLFLRFWL